jgi:hypothetical protein
LQTIFDRLMTAAFVLDSDTLYCVTGDYIQFDKKKIKKLEAPK